VDDAHAALCPVATRCIGVPGGSLTALSHLYAFALIASVCSLKHCLQCRGLCPSMLACVDSAPWVVKPAVMSPKVLSGYGFRGADQ